MNKSDIADKMKEKLDLWYSGQITRLEVEQFIKYGNLTEEQKKTLGLITFGSSCASQVQEEKEEVG